MNHLSVEQKSLIFQDLEKERKSCIKMIKKNNYSLSRNKFNEMIVERFKKVFFNHIRSFSVIQEIKNFYDLYNNSNNNLYKDVGKFIVKSEYR